MAMRGKARDKVIAALEKCETFGKETTGSAMRAERLPSSIGQGQFPADEYLPRSSDVQYVVWSYETPIAWVLKNGNFEVPDIKYSSTTTHHQHMCRVYMGNHYRF